MKENREKHRFFRMFQKWQRNFYNRRGRFFQKTEKLISEPPEETVDNPWIDATRQVVEQILMKKGKNYRTFCPIVIDTDKPDQVFGETDDVDRILEQLYPGLNFLEIATDRPEHFSEMTEWLAEEYGLLARILPISELGQSHADTVLDLEREGELYIQKFPRNVIYLPFYKRRWREYQKTGQNLDIEVPIGYNVVIVKVDKNLQNYR